MIDLDRCRRAMQDLHIEGDPRDKIRQQAIEDAITAILAKPESALRESYISVKNYSSFGDQREDHKYGYGPRHGSIVFRIGRRSPSQAVTLNADHLYYLEAYRDFMPVEVPGKQKLPLGAAIAAFDAHVAAMASLHDAFNHAVIETHEAWP